MELKPADKVLLLSLPPVEELLAMARQLDGGLVTALVDPEQVHEVRSLLRDCSNVMVTPSDPEAAIPWRDEFFTVVYAPEMEEPSAEVLRVLQPGGTAWVTGGPVVRR